MVRSQKRLAKAIHRLHRKKKEAIAASRDRFELLLRLYVPAPFCVICGWALLA
jgi:hypothetical protein